MRIHQLPWTELCPGLEVYERLSRRSRLALLEMQGTKSRPTGAFDEEGLEVLLDAALLRETRDRERVVAQPEARPLLLAIRAGQRCGVLSDTSMGSMVAYVQETYSRDERDELVYDDPYSYGDKARRIASRAFSGDWVLKMLEPSMCETWKRAHARGYARTRHVYTPAVRDDLERVVGALTARGGPAPALDLPALAGTSRPEALDRVFLAALRYLVVFPGIDADTGRLVFGLAPSALAFLTRGPAEVPEIVDVELEPIPAVRCADIQQVLLAIAGGHVRVRTDGAVFKKDAESIEASLQPLGRAARAAFRLEPADRVDAAIGHAAEIGFVLEGPGAGGRKRLVVTDAARKWLAEDARTRLQYLLDRLGPVPRAHVPPPAGAGSHESAFLTRQRTWGGLLDVYSPDAPRLIKALIAEMCRLPRDGGVDVGVFATFAGRERNPLLDPGSDASKRSWHRASVDAPRESREKAWTYAVLDAIELTLAAWGGVRIRVENAGDDDAQSVLVGLNATGAYALGLQDALPSLEEATARVIVQPTFDIVFLGPDTSAEAELAVFCERVGERVGSLFKITKASILRAAAAGVARDGILSALDRLSSEAVPGNVRAEITAWHGRQRVLVLEHPWILRCGDAETAARVVAAAPSKFERLGDDVVVVRGTTKPEAVSKILAAHGITIDTSKVPAPKKKRPARRRYSRRYW